MPFRVDLKWIKEGMVLGEDLLSDDGALLFPKGKALTREDVEKIKSMPNVSGAVIEGDDLFYEILDKQAMEAPDDIKRSVERAFMYCTLEDDLKDKLKKIALKYRVLLMQ